MRAASQLPGKGPTDVDDVQTYPHLTLIKNPIRQKKIVVFQVPCQKKSGSVGRPYFFFTFFFAYRHRQCHQAVGPGDMYYGRSFINSGKSRGPRTLPKGTP